MSRLRVPILDPITGKVPASMLPAPTAGFRGAWAPSTAYKAGELAIAPSSAPSGLAGRLVSANTDFTSGSSFSASNWTLAEHAETYAGPFAASTAYTAGQVVSYLGSLYSANADFTSGGSFNSADWTLLGNVAPSIQLATGVPPTGLAAQVTYYELELGQVVAVWIGMGPGNAPIQVFNILTGGVFTPMGPWSAGTAYSFGAAVSKGGGSYYAVASSTGIDPVTDDLTHWFPMALKGDKGDTGATGATGSAAADLAVLARMLSDFARDPSLMNGGGSAGTPTGQHVAQSMDRGKAAVNYALTGGTLVMVAVPVPGGRQLSGGSIKHGVAMSGGTHSWLGLFDVSTRALLATSADHTDASATASARRDFDFLTPYTPSTGRYVYVGFVQVATTPGSLTGEAQANAGGEAPIVAGTSTTGITTGGLPDPAAALTAKGRYWASLY